MYILKKSLGQHFLKDEKTVDKIVESLNQHSFQNLLDDFLSKLVLKLLFVITQVLISSSFSNWLTPQPVYPKKKRIQFLSILSSLIKFLVS